MNIHIQLKTVHSLIKFAMAFFFMSKVLKKRFQHKTQKSAGLFLCCLVRYGHFISNYMLCCNGYLKWPSWQHLFSTSTVTVLTYPVLRKVSRLRWVCHCLSYGLSLFYSVLRDCMVDSDCLHILLHGADPSLLSYGTCNC